MKGRGYVIGGAVPAPRPAHMGEREAGACADARASLAGRADEVMVRLSAGPSLEARLRSALPELLPALVGRAGPGAGGEAVSAGSPAALLVSPAAVYAQELRRQLRGLSPVPPRSSPLRAALLCQPGPSHAAACSCAPTI